MSYRDKSADTTLDNANEGIMSSEFEKWAQDNMMYGGDKWAAKEGWNMRQPEIDALNDKINTLLESAFNSSLTVGNLERENYRLKAENERLRKDAERLDWMEAHPRLGEIHVGGEVKDCYLYAVSGALGAPLRAIIDAAMSAPPDTKGE